MSGASNMVDLAGLERLPREALLERFREAYGRPPPKHLRGNLLCRAVAHGLQVKAAGGPDRALQRRLAALAKELRKTGRIGLPRQTHYKPGTRLLREWQGKTHAVTITEEGYLYRGRPYASLSRIAREITGTRWSGPAFFGLRKEAR